MHGTRFKWFRSENLLVRNALVILMLVAAVGLLILIASIVLGNMFGVWGMVLSVPIERSR